MADSRVASPAEEMALAAEAVRSVASVALDHLGAGVSQWLKDDQTPVSQADLDVDRALSEILRSARPDHGWLSEESGPIDSVNGRTVVIDPIDGTRAYLSGHTGWSVVVAMIEDGRPIAAAVYRPQRDELFTAAEGGGAWRNGVPIAVSTCTGLDGAVIACPKPLFRDSALATSGARRADWVPSLALRLAFVGSGRLDGVITRAGPHHWDLAAADLIVHEAGGSLTDVSGSVLRYDTAATRHAPAVAGPPEIAAALRRIAAQHMADAA